MDLSTVVPHSAAGWAAVSRVLDPVVSARSPARCTVSSVLDEAPAVAAAGDDGSADPILELVVADWPTQYMALYHAGMAEYALGQRGLARTHLESFLSLYHANDGWTSSARDALAHLQ